MVVYDNELKQRWIKLNRNIYIHLSIPGIVTILQCAEGMGYCVRE